MKKKSLLINNINKKIKKPTAHKAESVRVEKEYSFKYVIKA